MISKGFAKKQILRLAGLRGFPIVEEAVKDLVDVAESAGNDELLKAAVDEFVFNSPDCPKPVDLRRVIAQKSETEWRMRPTACEQCSDTGFITVRGKYSGPDPRLRERFQDQEFEAAAPCPCRGGSSQKAIA